MIWLIFLLIISLIRNLKPKCMFNIVKLNSILQGIDFKQLKALLMSETIQFFSRLISTIKQPSHRIRCCETLYVYKRVEQLTLIAPAS